MVPGSDRGQRQGAAAVSGPPDLSVVHTSFSDVGPELTDALTGLPQRPHVGASQRRALAAAGAEELVAVALVNVDGFCVVIESLGMPAADAALQQLAARLRVAATERGLDLARAGGDEFALVLPALGSAAAAEELTAQVVDAAFGRPLTVHGQVLYLSASSGIAVSPPDDPDELLRRATLALSSVKRAGGGRSATFHTRPSGSPRNLALYAELREAMANAELAPHYQPIIDVATSRGVGLEALLRWNHPTRGVVGPAEFLPPIAGSPLIEDLGLRVLRQACQDAVTLMELHPDLGYVAVNVAPRQLTRPEFAEQVAAALATAGLRPQHLVLEITETALVHDLSVARAALNALRAHGIRIALDDFGTGYATLTSLRQLPIDMLKIDRTFVSGLGQSHQDATIVASVVALARSIGIDAVAEGIETAEQAEAVRAVGCRLGQGYFWSPAVPAAAVGRVLQAVGSRAVPPMPVDEPAPVGDPVPTRRIIELHRAGASPRTIAAALNQAGLLTPAGRRWHPVQVTRAPEAALGSGD